MDPVKEFFTDLIAGRLGESKHAPNVHEGEDDPIDDDASQFSSKSFNDPLDRDIFGLSGGRPGSSSDNNPTNPNVKNDLIIENPPPLMDRNLR